MSPVSRMYYCTALRALRFVPDSFSRLESGVRCSPSTLRRRRRGTLEEIDMTCEGGVLYAALRGRAPSEQRCRACVSDGAVTARPLQPPD